jgi:hypothetical protein
LDHSLSDHDAPPLFLHRSFAVEIARQYGFTRFLDLEEQRTIGSLLLKQHNPATGADAAYTDNFACDIDDPVARQQALNAFVAYGPQRQLSLDRASRRHGGVDAE